MKSFQSPLSPGSPFHALGQTVLKQFQTWRRKVPIGSRRIPAELWKAAIKLAAATTVNQAARLLGLEYTQIQQRFLAVYGADHPAFPRRNQTKRAPTKKSDHAIINPKPNLAIPSTEAEPLLPITSRFVEATIPSPPSWQRPLLLAEIQSSKGALLRLFSPETRAIVEAFLQS